MKRIIISLTFAALSLGLAAQNLNPEVQVTNEYETRMTDVTKQGPEMAVPDSLLRFDYHFDYSVFDSPYKGSYEFSPYSVTITPDARPYDGRKLYLSGGAGYTFRPELEVVWAAIDRKRFALNLFTKMDGFLGQYRHIVPGTFELKKDSFHNGWDFDAGAGVDTRFKLGRVNFRAELGYEGIFAGHEIYHRDNCHAPYVQLGFSYDTRDRFSYTGGLSYRYVHDWLNGKDPIQDHEVLGDFTISMRPQPEYRINTDLNFVVNSFYWGLGLHPHAIFQLEALDIDAGFRVGWVADKFSASPDITAALHLFNDYLKVYAGATGRDHYTQYWDYKRRVHRYFGETYSDPLPVREIADLVVGIDGHADAGFQYDLKAGYRWVKDAPFWAVANDGMECLAFMDCSMFHADLAVNWASERLNLDGAVHYVKLPEGVPVRVFEPAMVTGTFKAVYNWKKRIYGGLSVDMSSARIALVDGYERKMPGYVDLGLIGEYNYNKRLSFWLKGSNILNHDVRLSPLYSQAGPSVIVGATFSL